MRRIVVAITGATGSIYGHKLLQHLATDTAIETHLVVSAAGFLTLKSELGLQRGDLDELAHTVHSDREIGATIASGSFDVEAMIVAPCSMKTLASIATGVAGTLTARTADVVLKERRRLILLARETPLNLVHLRNMVTVTEMGGVIFPPVPAFYAKPNTLEDIVTHTVGRVLDVCNVNHAYSNPWPGISSSLKE